MLIVKKKKKNRDIPKEVKNVSVIIPPGNNCSICSIVAKSMDSRNIRHGSNLATSLERPL